MTDENQEATQQTQPKGKDKDGKPYPPVEIPVPSKANIEGAIEKLAQPERPSS